MRTILTRLASIAAVALAIGIAPDGSTVYATDLANDRLLVLTANSSQAG